MNELRISFPFGTFGRRLVAETFGGGSGGAGGSPAEIDTFAFNNRSEVTSAILHSPFSILHSYGYDDIGNSTNWPANCLNQYTLCGSVPLCEFTYDADGNLLSDGVFTYAYDAANRLSSVTSNGVLLVTNFYDAQSRRVEKVAADGTHRFFYDGWLLVREALTTNNYQLTTDYVWGKDISGTRGGAAGIGGLLYVRRDGAIYVPRFDAYGNVRGYCDAQGSVVAEYTYDAFGNTIAQSGPMADDFALRFSTKYFDGEANLYYYGYRYYHPLLMRWLNRDPVGEEGGVNLYAFCGNSALSLYDKDGRAYFAYRPLKALRWIGVFGTKQDEIDNTIVGHENLFFEDGKEPGNLGYFKDGLHPDPDNYGYKVAHLRGDNDCIMRKAVKMVKPRNYKLLGANVQNGGIQYNCQDWADDVRWAYYCIIRNIPYYPSDTTFIGVR